MSRKISLKINSGSILECVHPDLTASENAVLITRALLESMGLTFSWYVNQYDCGPVEYLRHWILGDSPESFLKRKGCASLEAFKVGTLEDFQRLLELVWEDGQDNA